MRSHEQVTSRRSWPQRLRAGSSTFRSLGLSVAASVLAAPGLAQEFAPLRVVVEDGLHLVLGDLDGDGARDCISWGIDADPWWRANLGGGVYGPVQSIWQPSSPPIGYSRLSSLLTIDWDLDGDEDVVWAQVWPSHLYPDSFAIWTAENLGAGQFGLRDHLDACGAYPEQKLLALDADGDGDEDLAVVSDPNQDYDIPWGTEIRWTELPDVPPPGPTCHTVYQGLTERFEFATTADVDGDGHVDIITSGWDGSVYWYENLGAGSFAALRQDLLPAPAQYRGVEFVDLDADGDLDLLASEQPPFSQGPGKLAWYENLGNAVFGPQQSIWSGVDLEPSIGTADFDGDGDVDLIVAKLDGTGVWFVENLGGAVFLAPVQISEQGSRDVLVDDVDGDGDFDVLVRSQGDVHLLENLSVAPGDVFCTGDSSLGFVCPCGNESAPGSDEGCTNSTGFGARLRTSGSMLVVHENLILRVSQARPSQPLMLLQGRNEIALPFKDGILCAGSPSLRILRSTLDADGTASTDGTSVVELGAISGPGERRYYQAWFRDPQLSVCGTGSNLTNGVLIDWQ